MGIDIKNEGFRAGLKVKTQVRAGWEIGIGPGNTLATYGDAQGICPTTCRAFGMWWNDQWGNRWNNGWEGVCGCT